MAGRYRHGVARRDQTAPRPAPPGPRPAPGDEYLPSGSVPHRTTWRLGAAILAGLVLLLLAAPLLMLLLLRTLCYVMCDPG